LTDLQYLIVSKNSLEAIPNSIGQNKNLKYFNANQNEIARIPYSFGFLEELEYLDLWSNNLEYYPETLVNLKKLKSVDLRNILIPQDRQDELQAMLPNVLIYFSPPCRCSW
jgi:Leucine-rich repeat (LRR) protein